ncbi:Solute carrier family 40 member 1 [Vanrija pseudolonga]|uniref:Solute carrier family 40 member n=1 Tax=Vanrija pseudolonga TaxID=143232 RepID=A0AAF1BKI0_9TREE|nr:Solute carrier family 40 member 1 [Vanrija pseudolonga]
MGSAAAVIDDDERAPLLTSGSSQRSAPASDTGAAPASAGTYAVPCLLLQHVSSTINAGLYDFGAFLFLIDIFADTLVPSALVGLFTTLSGLLLSGYIGGLVDRTPRLRFLRRAIGAEKFFHGANYALFLLLFGPLQPVASAAFHFRASTAQNVAVWACLLLTIMCSSLLGLANTGLTVAIERDWVTCIARGDTALLTQLNTYMRRIDLVSKLVSPLLVSFLTVMWGYEVAVAILLAFTVVTAATESVWIGVVYRCFPALSRQDHGAVEAAVGHVVAESTEDGAPEVLVIAAPTTRRTWSQWFAQEKADWAEFVRLPVFGSSVAIATIYLTTLSYDGTFIAYVKAARGYDDTFIAGMRAVCLVTGLLGTALMPLLERAVGLERAGAWSIWSEVVCLSPVVVSFFYGAGAYGEHGPSWNTGLLFGGIALSRIGLWSFDLCQLKVLQLALDDHPRRNRMTALQIALQNLFNLAKYAVTLAAATPAQFKWTALVSWFAVVAGAGCYAAYLRSVRGHLVHVTWLKKLY